METPNFNVEKFPTRYIFIIFRSRYIKVFNFDVPSCRHFQYFTLAEKCSKRDKTPEILWFL